MIKVKFLSITLLLIGSFTFWYPTMPTDNNDMRDNIPICYTDKGCIFKTIFGEERADLNEKFNTPDNLQLAIESGLTWMERAQQADGGWGAGSHNRQNIVDPHAVNTDPATTAMVAMALMRTGNRPDRGKMTKQLNDGIEYLLKAVELTPANGLKITREVNTQIQTKLGQNIDVILTAQCLSNVLNYLNNDSPMHQRVTRALDRCVNMIEKLQENDGSIQGAGWAGVLQSSLANNALESAADKGADVDLDALKKSRAYQKGNFDASSNEVNTEKGAGIVLYSVTGTARASAKQARKVKEEFKRAKDEGKLESDQPVNKAGLMELGWSENDADEYFESYQVYESTKDIAQRDDVMQGFGNNGGEEYLSYLQTGESLIINQDEAWKKWFENISGRVITLQNEDGSWNGHHCITSPVFCTATALLILSINNDFEILASHGAD